MIHITEKARQFSETDIPGFRTSPLWEEDGDGAYFAEFKAGARFPLHDHEGVEQFLVLSGRIRFNEVEMTAGDFLKAGAGDEHAAYALEDTLALIAYRGGVIVKG
ncbi:MAG TPA: cupin domain-containing protein [Dongiaceae bacterium]|jgi:anti-sigma factor ChrR (cupin superfamily)